MNFVFNGFTVANITHPFITGCVVVPFCFNQKLVAAYSSFNISDNTEITAELQTFTATQTTLRSSRVRVVVA